MKILILSLMIIACCGVAYSQEKKDIISAPFFANLGSIGNNSSLSMRCTGEAPYSEIDCDFVQVMIMKPNSETRKESRRQVEADVDKMPQKELNALVKDLSKKSMDEAYKNIETGTPEQKAYFNEVASQLQKLLKNPDRATVKKVMAAIADVEDTTCSVVQNSYSYHMMRVSRNKWIHNPGPGGLCNVVRVTTIENTDEYPELWTYSSIIASADQDELCKKWVDPNEPRFVAKWNSPKTLKFEQCKYIQFGY